MLQTVVLPRMPIEEDRLVLRIGSHTVVSQEAFSFLFFSCFCFFLTKQGKQRAVLSHPLPFLLTLTRLENRMHSQCARYEVHICTWRFSDHRRISLSLPYSSPEGSSVFAVQ